MKKNNREKNHYLIDCGKNDGSNGVWWIRILKYDRKHNSDNRRITTFPLNENNSGSLKTSRIRYLAMNIHIKKFGPLKTEFYRKYQYLSRYMLNKSFELNPVLSTKICLGSARYFKTLTILHNLSITKHHWTRHKIDKIIFGIKLRLLEKYYILKHSEKPNLNYPLVSLGIEISYKFFPTK